MERLRFSARYFLLLATCIGVATFWYESPAGSYLERTDRELDVAIVGRGYLMVTPYDGNGEALYTRCGRLRLDEYGLLSLTASGRRFLVDPPVSISSDHNRIAIGLDGRVQYSDSFGSWTDIGSITLASFSCTDPFVDPLTVNRKTEDLGPPIVGIPGESGLGVLQQGWIERKPSQQRALAKATAFGIFGGAVLGLLLRIHDSVRVRNTA